MDDNDNDGDDNCCPDCFGDVVCLEDGSWRCVADRGHWIGCGWAGESAECRCQDCRARRAKTEK